MNIEEMDCNFIRDIIWIGLRAPGIHNLLQDAGLFGYFPNFLYYLLAACAFSSVKKMR